MNVINTGYKVIAIVSLSYALFSCTDSVQSQSNSEVLARLNTIESKIDALSSTLGMVHVAVQPHAGEVPACTIEEVVNQTTSNCDTGKLPEEVSASATYCIAQERGGEIGGEYAIGLNTDIDVGAGWPNVVWGKVTAKMETPVPSPIAIPYPSQVAASGSISLGRGLEICVDIPIGVIGLEPDQVAQIHDLVRGVNEGQGTYSRRTGRLLNYAARRTPVAVANKARDSVSAKPATEDADDAFDIADAAIDKLIEGDFQPVAHGPQMFTDPVFMDLISALDVPTPAMETILDPERLFESMTVIGQSNIADACTSMGISQAARDRSPALANQCARFGIYPNINNALNSLDFIADVRGRVNSMYTASGLRSFMCSNIALAVFAPNCP
jgi:hypothetical protein